MKTLFLAILAVTTANSATIRDDHNTLFTTTVIENPSDGTYTYRYSYNLPTDLVFPDFGDTIEHDKLLYTHGLVRETYTSNSAPEWGPIEIYNVYNNTITMTDYTWRTPMVPEIGTWILVSIGTILILKRR